MQFTQQMNEIARAAQESFDAPTVERFARELNRGDNQVSFSRLEELYQENVMNVKSSDIRYDDHKTKHIERILWHIAEVVNAENIQLTQVI